jgi:general secretion pathway protein I
LRTERGFTLVEVIVAFLLLAMVLTTGFEVFTAGMRRAIDLEERSQALAVAQSRLAVVGPELEVKENSISGQTEDGKFRWTQTIARSKEGEADPGGRLTTAYGLYRIEVVVSWRGADEREHTLSLATLELGSIL